MKQRILFICGSMNQTTMMHAIAQALPHHYECVFTPYYADGIIHRMVQWGYLQNTVLSGAFRKATLDYLHTHRLIVDDRGMAGNYSLVVTCSDLIIPKNIVGKPMVLVQEGMTDPENVMYHIVKALRLPRYLASTSTTGLSHAYTKFCVASEGYKEHFIRKGVRPERVVVTGIPNYDNSAQFLDNNFPYKNYVLVATSDARETFKIENRKRFIRDAVRIAHGRQLIFKFHPNEDHERAIHEVEKYAPGALSYTSGNIGPMIANCDVLITRFSTVVYTGIALGKEVYSAFDIEELRKMSPLQNGGTSAIAIADICCGVLHEQTEFEQSSTNISYTHKTYALFDSLKQRWAV
jgi:hypothetical protein